jgi:hypothetical protein
MGSLWIFLWACMTPAPSTSNDPCVRAWESQRDALLQLHQSAGKPPPTLPKDEVAVRACHALDLSAEQRECLDPTHALLHPQPCDELLPVQARGPWNAWLLDHVANAPSTY